MDTQAHDLLWLTEAAGVEFDGPCPAWLTPAWLRVSPLVVRREATVPPRLPVGLRGTTRSERCKAYVADIDVAQRITPEMLATKRHRPGGIAALSAFSKLAPALDDIGLAWGPTGGVGFFLASGLPVLGPDSDLDLLVRAPQPLSATQCAALAALAPRVACRIDIQVDTGRGAFALAEWLRRGRGVLLKTDAGPVLSDDPWRAVA